MSKFTIIKSLVPIFEEKLNKFIRKYGEDSVSYTKSEPYVSSQKERFNKYVVDIEVEGTYKLEGYEFVASLEWVDKAQKNLIKTISSDAVVPEMYVTRTECDHCNVKRFRKYTTLLKNIETGEYVQVGNSCVKDFLGVDICDYAAYISFWNSLAEFQERQFEDELFRRTREDNSFEVKEVLCQTIEDVKARGYISKSQTEETGNQSTSTRIWAMMNEMTNGRGEIEVPKYKISDSTKEEVSQLIEWIKNYPINENNNYERNLQILSSLNWIDNNNLGLLVSLVGFKLRKDNEDKARKESTSNYVGKIGDKLTFTAIPQVLTSYDSEYGTVFIYQFTVEDNKLIWKTTNCLDNNKEVTLKGTIKNHSEFRGIKQTELTRCRVVA